MSFTGDAGAAPSLFVRSCRPIRESKRIGERTDARIDIAYRTRGSDGPLFGATLIFISSNAEF